MVNYSVARISLELRLVMPEMEVMSYLEARVSIGQFDPVGLYTKKRVIIVSRS
jgi:hypothetical protein